MHMNIYTYIHMHTSLVILWHEPGLFWDGQVPQPPNLMRLLREEGLGPSFIWAGENVGSLVSPLGLQQFEDYVLWAWWRYTEFYICIYTHTCNSLRMYVVLATAVSAALRQAVFLRGVVSAYLAWSSRHLKHVTEGHLSSWASVGTLSFIQEDEIPRRDLFISSVATWWRFESDIARYACYCGM